MKQLHLYDPEKAKQITEDGQKNLKEINKVLEDNNIHIIDHTSLIKPDNHGKNKDLYKKCDDIFKNIMEKVNKTNPKSPEEHYRTFMQMCTGEYHED